MGSSPSGCPRASSLAAERLRIDALLEEERRAKRDGYRSVAGVDEVGRGCLAGAVWAGAVALDPESPILGLNDSKLVPPPVRAELAETIRRKALGVGLGSASPREIDLLGIAEATALAMRRALAALRDAGVAADLALVDGREVRGLGVPQRAFVGGDRRVAAIAAASIVAKVLRDGEMEALDARLPHYGFGAHKGYGTAAHLRALRRHGPSPLHRLRFDGVVPGRLPRPSA